MNRRWRSWPARLAALATLLPMHAFAQAGPSRYYVAHVVGSWLATDSAGPHALHALDLVPAGATLGVDPGARIDSMYEIVLRDPRSLRTARWRCTPVPVCSGRHRASELASNATTLKTSPRTGALFIDLGQSDEERSAVKLVGARGVARDWGLVVLAADSGKLDLVPLLSRARGLEEDLVVRICPIDSRANDASSCHTNRTMGANDCALTSATPCTAPLAGNTAIPVRLEILNRVDSLVAEVPTARAAGVVTSARSRVRVAERASDYMRDLDALGSRISREERLALELAAARRLSQHAP